MGSVIPRDDLLGFAAYWIVMAALVVGSVVGCVVVGRLLAALVEAL